MERDADLIVTRLNIADEQSSAWALALDPFFNDGVVHLIISVLANGPPRAATGATTKTVFEV